MPRYIHSDDEGYADLAAQAGAVRPYDSLMWQLVTTPTESYFVEVVKTTEVSSFGNPLAGFHGFYFPDEGVLPDQHELEF